MPLDFTGWDTDYHIDAPDVGMFSPGPIRRTSRESAR
jgi:hypothetical protein